MDPGDHRLRLPGQPAGSAQHRVGATRRHAYRLSSNPDRNTRIDKSKQTLPTPSLHTLPDNDDTALDALSRIRHRGQS